MSVLAAVKIGDSLQQALDSFVGFLPNLIGFLVILVVGYIIAKVVKAVLVKVLQRAGLDKALHSGHSGRYVEQIAPGASPANLVGVVAFWLIFLFVLTAAIGALGIPAVTTFMNQVLAYLPNIIAAVLIFVVAGVVASAIAMLVTKTMGDTPTGKLVATVAPLLIMAIATFMILNQLRIAPAIVTITYAVLLGSLGLGMALAFGLGGRETAGQLVSGAYTKAQGRTDQVKHDIQTGKQRGQDQAEHAKVKANGDTDGSTPIGSASA